MSEENWKKIGHLYWLVKIAKPKTVWVSNNRITYGNIVGLNKPYYRTRYDDLFCIKRVYFRDYQRYMYKIFIGRFLLALVWDKKLKDGDE